MEKHNRSALKLSKTPLPVWNISCQRKELRTLSCFYFLTLNTSHAWWFLPVGMISCSEMFNKHGTSWPSTSDAPLHTASLKFWPLLSAGSADYRMLASVSSNCSPVLDCLGHHTFVWLASGLPAGLLIICFSETSASFYIILEAPVQKEVECVISDQRKGLNFNRGQRSNLVFFGGVNTERFCGEEER